MWVLLPAGINILLGRFGRANWPRTCDSPKWRTKYCTRSIILSRVWVTAVMWFRSEVYARVGWHHLREIEDWLFRNYTYMVGFDTKTGVRASRTSRNKYLVKWVWSTWTHFPTPKPILACTLIPSVLFLKRECSGKGVIRKTKLHPPTFSGTNFVKLGTIIFAVCSTGR